MSASREKKQRQGSGPSDRAAQTQREQAAYQRKVRAYTAIGIVATVLVAALLIWNTGIFQSRATAATVGSTEYNVTELSYFYHAARNDSFYFYYYLGSTPPDEDSVMDEESGQTYREHFTETALDSLTNLTALYDAAIADGYTAADVADDVREIIDSYKSAASTNGYGYAAFLKTQYGRYMSSSAFKSIITKTSIANAYYQAHQESLVYGEDEIQSYYEENRDSLDTFEYSYLSFTRGSVPTTDEEGNPLELTDEERSALEAEALAEAKEKAQAALDAIENGDDIDDVIAEHLPNANGSHLTALGSTISSSYSEELFTLEEGQASLVENDDAGYYVIMVHSRAPIQTPTADVRHLLVKAETTTDDEGNTVEPTSEAWSASLAKAEELLAKYEAGPQTEDAFAALVNEYSEDTGSNTTGGLYTEIAEDSSYVSEFLAWIFGDTRPKTGDTGIVRHEGDSSDYNPYWGYHIMYSVGDNEPAWKLNATKRLKDQDMTQWVDELESGYTAALASGADYLK